jgi:hypothetical protein
MKKSCLIIAGILLVIGLVFAAVIGFRLYFAYQQIAMAKLVVAEQIKREQEQDLANRQSKATNRPGPSVVDLHGYQTEDNWIAVSISHEIADLVALVNSPGQPPSNLQVTAKVDPEQSRVHVSITGWNGAASPLQADLTPAFAWDANGYAPLARQLLGNTPGSAPEAGAGSDDIINRLLNLTGAEIATEDVQVSERLQRFPASPTHHETAALVLVALALRENAGVYRDNRLLLNRATAHLALAKACRADQPETLSGLLAEAAILTLSGRQLDATAALDALAARPGIIDAAKVWISALRLLVSDDWRMTEVQPDSPLLLKILWFQVLCHNFTDLAATHRLDPLLESGTDPAQDQVPDWGRALVATADQLSVENSQHYTVDNLQLEFAELNEVLKIEGEPAADTKHLGATFAGPEERTVSSTDQGAPVVHVIGAGLFKAATRRHLFDYIKPVEKGFSEGLGSDEQAETFKSEMRIVFRDVPLFEYVEADTRRRKDLSPSACWKPT